MRKVRDGVDKGGVAHASMGPQLDSCGRGLGALPLHNWQFRLQWGRNLTVAEGCTNQDGPPDGATLQWGRNLTVAEGAGAVLDRARAAVLQWGRNLTVAEGAMRRKLRGDPVQLQWGRNLTVAEGATATRLTKLADQASMGPQLDSCGRARRRCAACPSRTGFNGAAT